MTEEHDASPGWLQENSKFLLVLAIVLLGGGAVNWYMPRAAEKSRREAWELYSQFEVALSESESSSAMLTALLTVEGNDKSYPWALVRAASWAADRQDKEALEAVMAKMDSVSPGASQAKVLEDGQPMDLLASMKGRISGLGELAELEPVQAEPTGPEVEFTLTASSGETYAFTYKLYTDQAPATTAHLLAKISDDSFGSAGITTMPQGGFQLDGLAADGTEALPIERAWGCFHQSGTLCTVLEGGGEPGQQSAAKFQFLGTDLYGQDGVTTVVGKITAGEDVLASLATLEKAEGSPNKFAAEFKVSAKIKE
jgi:hypothetical protein